MTTKKMKQHLEDVITATINEDTSAASEAFHEYVSLKTQAILLGEKEDEKDEKDKDEKEVDKDIEKLDKDEKKEDKAKKSGNKKEEDKEEKEEKKDMKKLKKDQKKDEKDDVCPKCGKKDCTCMD